MAIVTDFYRKQGDTGPPLVIDAEYADGSPVNEDFSHCQVEFHMMTANGAIIVAAGAGTVVDADAKQIGYQPAVGDFDLPSDPKTPHQCEFQCTFLNEAEDTVLEVITFPNASNINVHVKAQIA